VRAGETLGIVGESGSGKSVAAFSAMGLLDHAGKISAGTIWFKGQDLLASSPQQFQALRGAQMSMIFQNPRAALNPIRTVGLQIADALQAHRRGSAAELRDHALQLLRLVKIRDPEHRLDAYPHELSGGMCQRVMIAMAIACEPALLIADEPTTGLDVTTQKVIMDLLATIAAERGMGVVLITHDLGLAAQYCQNVVVMERGLVVEQAPPIDLFSNPQHPYTKRLVAASPTRTSKIEDLVSDEGGAILLRPARTPRSLARADAVPLLTVRNLFKWFDQSTAVQDVSFSIHAGESLGLVGESGSGKSTISRLVCRLIDQSAGEIAFDGEAIGTVPARTFNKSALRKDIQIVFQDPHDSLNPRFTAFDCIAHPLRRLLGIRGRTALAQRVLECAQRVGLPAELLDRFPHQLSGGQKARVGIARAIATKPRLLVLDEPTAALDVSVQAVILQLLVQLRQEEQLSYLFVSHDLNVVRMLCDRTIVLRHGQIVEQGPSQQLFETPTSEYARELVSSIPHFAPKAALRARNMSPMLRKSD
jgi:peptide/nickel transport system ATP-binding protein